ncbi:class I SAM-dependent methyltransferase [Desulfitobacterium dehalogenans]|nr:class I SAM-dependent methyltransferase [Desulfitobacterium dehalogenans]
MMSNDLKTYYENIKKPWNTLYYRIVWEQLSRIHPIINSKILDFGSGLGITADYLSKNNDVVAIEPNVVMVEMRICKNGYQQIVGDLEQLRQQQDASFDVVVCHNVLEYTKERNDIFKELYRVLKPNGVLSIVKHNHAGRIMQKVVFENNLDAAIMLLNGGKAEAAYFGEVNYYELNDIEEWMSGLDINIERVLGIRAFFALHSNNEVRYDTNWQEKMFDLEMKVSDIRDFINISFFNHVLLKKIR